MTRHILGALLCSLVLVSNSGWAEGLAGTWTLSIDTPRGVQHPTLVVVPGETGYQGVYNSLRGPIEIQKIDSKGNSFAFPLTISIPIGEIQVHYRGTINGNDMRGSVQNPRGEVPFTGKRTPQ